MYMDLCSPGTIKKLLDNYGLAPKKGFGQNFLVNSAVPEKIAAAAASVSDDLKAVLEIGPGLGTLTRELCGKFKAVAAVEIDRGLIPLLGETLAEYGNVSIINADFMEIELADLFRECFGDARPAVCANLPYYITTPIIMKLIEDFPYSERLPYTSITVMVQSEVADRLASSPESGDYGAVTASVGLRCQVRRVMSVSPGSFYPPPKVSSAVIQLIPHENGIYSVYDKAPATGEECEKFGKTVSELISLAFSMRRKTLVNALSSVYPKNKTAEALNNLGMRDDVRGEKLSSRDFCALASLLLQQN